MNIKIECPECGGTQLAHDSESREEGYRKAIGAKCVTCGHVLTEDEVESIIQGAIKGFRGDLGL